ncbi:MAG TPA: glycosyltransferase [Tepidisphaeraceae bacterium]|nr:glycosyltransferase [Tepidisphaeraceae bacterium]
MTGPKISFGMIVFNGDYFLRQCLDGVYDFAHEIVIVEGGDAISQPFANPDGTSTDQTWEILAGYPDPKNKIKLIRGRFKDKDEQSNAYMSQVSGDFIWQIDSDELYHPADMNQIAGMLYDDSDLMAVEFPIHDFYGGLDRVAVGKHWNVGYWRIHRLFPGSRYLTHRPPTVVHPNGQSMNHMKHLDRFTLAGHGIFLHHYSYVLDRQVREKIRYHSYWRPTQYPKEKDVNYFHYDYIEKIWEPWKYDRERVEREIGISPNIYRDTAGNIIKDHTVMFEGSHPVAVQSHPLFEQTYTRELRRCA